MAERKIHTSVGFSPRQISVLEAEAKRLGGISFGDTVRRAVDEWIDAREARDRPKTLRAAMYGEAGKVTA